MKTNSCVSDVLSLVVSYRHMYEAKTYSSKALYSSPSVWIEPDRLDAYGSYPEVLSESDGIARQARIVIDAGVVKLPALPRGAS